MAPHLCGHTYQRPLLASDHHGISESKVSITVNTPKGQFLLFPKGGIMIDKRGATLWNRRVFVGSLEVFMVNECFIKCSRSGIIQLRCLSLGSCTASRREGRSRKGQQIYIEDERGEGKGRWYVLVSYSCIQALGVRCHLDIKADTCVSKHIISQKTGRRTHV